AATPAPRPSGVVGPVVDVLVPGGEHPQFLAPPGTGGPSGGPSSWWSTPSSWWSWWCCCSSTSSSRGSRPTLRRRRRRRPGRRSGRERGMCDERPRADLLVSRNRTAYGVANKPQVQLKPQRRRTATLQEASRPQSCLAGELKTKAKTTKEEMLKEMNPRTGKTS